MNKIIIIGVSESADWHELSGEARSALKQAELVFGAPRHLQKLGDFSKGKPQGWRTPLSESLTELDKAHKSGKNIVVLATGDPMFFGIGATLARRFKDNITVLPAVGAFAAATASLGWASEACAFITLHGRALASLRRYLQPQGKLLILSHDKTTPKKVAEFLQKAGYPSATMHVLCDLGGADEKIFTFDDLGKVTDKGISDLNSIAVSLNESGGESEAQPLPPYMLLRDDEFHHDGQITKEEVRAVTMLRLRPYRGAHLWDLGAGCGSISLGWALGGGTVTSIEQHAKRCAFIKTNAEEWGLEDAINIMEGDLNTADFANLPRPQAIFCGGGVDSPDLLETAYKHLENKGIFVINAVTLEACDSVIGFHKKHGGSLSRLQIERAEELGGRQAFKPLRTVLQFYIRKA